MPAGQTAQIFFDSNIIKVTADLNNIEWTTSGETKTGVIGSNFTVSLNSGYIIDTIACTNCTLGTQQDTTFTMMDLATTETSIITITSKQSTPTLTFKHFFDAGTIGTGTIKFRHYSQQEPISGETWVLNESLTDTTGGGGFSANVSFTSYSNAYTAIQLLLRAGRDGVIVHYDSTEVYNSVIDDGWYDQPYRTITFSETVTDSTLLAWLQANGTKQGGGGEIIKAGTYQFIEDINFPTGIDIAEKITATINTLTENDVYGSQKTIDTINVAQSGDAGALSLFNEEPYYDITYALDWEYNTEDGEKFYVTDTAKLRTIIIATDQTVTNELYQWFTANTTKLS